MRLLLDEHFSPLIARNLRSDGHDVEAVAERPDLVALPDRELFARMPAEQRAIVTNDVLDYLTLFNQALTEAREHFGLLFTEDRSMPRGRNTVGLFVRVLGEFLSAHPRDDALRNQIRWLP